LLEINEDFSLEELENKERKRKTDMSVSSN